MAATSELRYRGPHHDHEMDFLDTNHKSDPSIQCLDNDETHRDVLYEDRTIKVTRDSLTIKRYYFPFMNSKKMKWRDIKSVRSARDAGVKWYELKPWGFGWGNICWAAQVNLFFKDNDGKRHLILYDRLLDSSIIVQPKDSSIRPGAYIERPEEAFKAINLMLIYIDRQETSQSSGYADSVSEMSALLR